jgi:ABC-type antimicrobial peptide transport system permease subunit
MGEMLFGGLVGALIFIPAGYLFAAFLDEFHG